MRDATDTPSFDRSVLRPDLLGAQHLGDGTNFALFSEHADAVELCLFDRTGTQELHRLMLPEMEGGIWHGFLPGVGPGQVYGYRVHGPYAPEQGHRFNPNKLLLDPYAQELRGRIEWHDALHGYVIGQDDLSFDERDSAPYMVKGVVADTDFDWESEAALRTHWTDTVIYEAHVKGLTQLHPGVPETLRGTFAGLASDAVIDHLLRIGVTAIELLPVHAFANDRHLADKGLSNYWGYNTLSFFAPHAPYLRSGQIREMKEAIRRFHKAGIEVILDVVYNHSCEGNELGQTLSFRGIDNASYYLLSDDPRHSFDTTGTGNTLNVAHPMVLRMVMDSLRYWVEAMHVNGFRFDLASTLGREAEGFERHGSFFNALRQDPVLSGIKLIAEPWDIGEGGYQVGGYPWPFREWNDKFRDDTRAFWRRDPALVPAMAERLSGSPVQFDHSHRPATSSVNFVAAHDGFTLWDTLSFNDKHNDANGEDGRDGHDHNLSDNMGAEGPTGDASIDEARSRRARAILATVLLSQGVPMLLAGDEIGNSQGGNNNAYCQDNDISWLDWASARDDLTDAVAALTAFRRDAGLSRPRFAMAGQDLQDRRPVVEWLHPEGRPLGDADWADEGLQTLGMMRRNPDGARVLIVLNAGEDAEFVLPPGEWTLRIDSAAAPVACERNVTGRIPLPWQSVLALTEDGSGEIAI
ncbi:glycogen debranching protein GlgX [Paracoccus zeaxanthinifaciens]|uniref:glycogen debranching protein GlgX n=1 Tax=Paracoccus zeaxanthinifaciens TaxID=187400 RepID=UPI0004157155|nr:glycogen debranching protein GlgX [Paracoccus zeaxanthinifaciens]